jgi:hypothetical protein
MSEMQPQLDHEHAREVAFASLVEQYFPKDKAFIMEMDFDDALGFIYGQLMEIGEDPDTVLQEFGVTEVQL